MEPNFFSIIFFFLIYKDLAGYKSVKDLFLVFENGENIIFETFNVR